MSKQTVAYIMPTVAVKDFVNFTNDFTIWTCEAQTTIGPTTRVSITIDAFDGEEEEKAHIDDYVESWLKLRTKGANYYAPTMQTLTEEEQNQLLQNNIMYIINISRGIVDECVRHTQTSAVRELCNANMQDWDKLQPIVMKLWEGAREEVVTTQLNRKEMNKEANNA